MFRREQSLLLHKPKITALEKSRCVSRMEKTEKRPGYFARLKKKRQLKQSQSEKADAEQNQSDLDSKTLVIQEPAPIGRSQKRNVEKRENDDGSGEHSDNSSKSGTQTKKEKTRPPGTVEYMVEPKDTLNSIALHFNITPNKLVHLNRLYSHSVVPGQKLFVPDEDEAKCVSQVSDCSKHLAASESTEIKDGEYSSRPGRPVCRETSPLSEDESPATVKFIKMSCKYFTDGMGVVGGVMIITPNNVMFDPHKSDPLVIENGCEEYGLICPMQEVLSVALYDDVSRMKIKDALPSPGEWEELPSEQDLNPFSRYESLGSSSLPIVLDDIETAVVDASDSQIADKSPSDEGFTELELLQSDSNTSCSGLQGATLQEHTKTPEDEDEGLHNRSTDDSVEVTKRRSQMFANRPNVEESKGSNAELSEAEKRKRASEAEMKSWLLKRMQKPIEDMLLSNEEKSKAPPMFLCFKVGKPMRKSFAIGRTSSPTHSYTSRGRQLEYWFAVPQERVDHLYSFFIQWSPDTYGKDAQDQGFVVVEKDELTMIDNFFSDPVPRSWEIITINEAKRRQSFSFEDEEPVDLLPALLDPSALLEDTHIEKLSTRLPARVQGYPWRLVYSTVVHGTSLKTLYRNLMVLDCPVLMVIKDMDNQIFGVFSTHPFRMSEHYYGTGETFLYSFCPEIKVYRWTGENSYFVKGNTDSLQIGGGEGLGLWLDADFYHGTTSRCSTFNNQPLSSKQDFTIQDLEVWTFE